MPATKTLALTALSLALLTAIIAAGSCTEKKKPAEAIEPKTEPAKVIYEPIPERTKPEQVKPTVIVVEPAPVVVEPPQIVVQPAPVTVPPPQITVQPAAVTAPNPTIIVQPAPVTVQPAPAHPIINFIPPAPAGPAVESPLKVEVVDSPWPDFFIQWSASLLGAVVGGLLGLFGVWLTIRSQEDIAAKQATYNAYADLLTVADSARLKATNLLINPTSSEQDHADYYLSWQAMRAAYARATFIDNSLETLTLAKDMIEALDWEYVYHHSPFNKDVLQSQETTNEALKEVLYPIRHARFELLKATIGEQKTQALHKDPDLPYNLSNVPFQERKNRSVSLLMVYTRKPDDQADQ